MGAVPGVLDVGTTDIGPGSASAIPSSFLTLQTDELPPGADFPPVAQVLAATPRYMSAAGIPLMAGRYFSQTDESSGTRVVILNDVAARLLGGVPSDLIGRQLPLGVSFWGRTPSQPQYHAEIIGIVRGVRLDDLGGDRVPQVYQLFGQHMEPGTVTLAIETAIASDLVLPHVRRVAEATVPDAPIYSIRTMDRVQHSMLSEWRLAVGTAGSCAFLALLLCGLGIYGTLSHQVTVRYKEFGVRLALGALPGELCSSVIGWATRVTVTGVLCGAVCVWFTSNVGRHVFAALAPASLLSTCVAAITVLLVAVGAAAIPARRASQAAPDRLLRMD